MTGGGPLHGIRVVEFAGLGPAPFAAMLLADLGAEVLRIERPDAPARKGDILARGRASLRADLRDPSEADRVREIVRAADVLIEGFRPGVMERLGLGPDALCEANPRLIYVRVTGWGQTGPLAQTAGHDINYIALAGVLGVIGAPSAPPPPPLNLVGDFGGGALYAALGVAAALVERGRSGVGQVIDAAMVDGAASLLAMYLSHRQGSRAGTGFERGSYFLDGSAPWYRCYECADGRHIALGAIEPQFWATFLEKLGLDRDLPRDLPDWAETSRRLEAVFRTRARDEWAAFFDGTDACVTPVLAWDELALHPHLAARGTYILADGLLQPEAAPRFSRTAAAASAAPRAEGEELARLWLSSPAG